MTMPAPSIRRSALIVAALALLVAAHIFGLLLLTRKALFALTGSGLLLLLIIHLGWLAPMLAWFRRRR